MKRKITMLIILCLCAVMICSCGAGGDKGETTAAKKGYITKGEVEKLAVNGKIKEVEFKLGSSYDDIMTKYYIDDSIDEDDDEDNEVDEDNEQTTVPATTTALPKYRLHIYEGNTLTSLQYGGATYFFVNGSRDEGVAVIACSSKAYNFPNGNCFSQDVVYSLGKPDSEDVPAKDDLFYMFGTPSKVKRLTYNFGKNRLDFIFVKDNLAMTVLTDTELYTEMGDSASDEESQTSNEDDDYNEDDEDYEEDYDDEDYE